MKHYSFNLHISAEQYLDYYRGTAKFVIARTVEGQTVQFPASLLQRFISQDGVHGNFELICDDRHKVVELRKSQSFE